MSAKSANRTQRVGCVSYVRLQMNCVRDDPCVFVYLCGQVPVAEWPFLPMTRGVGRAREREQGSNARHASKRQKTKPKRDRRQLEADRRDAVFLPFGRASVPRRECERSDACTPHWTTEPVRGVGLNKGAVGRLRELRASAVFALGLREPCSPAAPRISQGQPCPQQRVLRRMAGSPCFGWTRAPA